MDILQTEVLSNWYDANFEKNLSGRRILFDDIAPLISGLSSKFKKEVIGHSENGIPINKISVGNGKVKILIWSQMHGNESTGTKALFDIFKFFDNEEVTKGKITESILSNCSLEIITLLNPDGAVNFTRENDHKIDLNRDAVEKKAVESRLLRETLDKFKPKFCFNLHDQRTIFNVKGTANPATLSFLAPSEDIERTVTRARKETMSVIVAINTMLQQIIPNQVGRYSDEFYPSATGDNFQKLGHNTILIEAGHYKDDHSRESTRKFNFYALLQGLYFIATTKNFDNYKPYFSIPNNDALFLDMIYNNIKITENSITRIVDVGIQIKYKVSDNKLIPYKCIEKIGNLSNYHSNNLINAENLNFNELKLSNS